MAQNCITEKPSKREHKPEVFAIDIDGTITFNDHSISEYTISEFRNIKKDFPNIRFILVTGRSYKNAARVCHKLSITDDLLITNNGSVLTTIHKFEPMIQNILSQNAVEIVFEYAKKNNLAAAALYGDGEEILIPEFITNTEEDMFAWLGDSKIVRDANKIYTENIYQLCVFGNNKLIEKTVAYFEQYGLNVWVYEREKSFALEINGPTTNKWGMIKKYCKKNNLFINNVVVMGNGTNDVPMFENAAYSVAVNNAVPVLHDLATEICLSNEENGVVKFIRKHLNKYYSQK
ncbi:HAD-IIB family hydrolase [Spiroplasma endosymbiont of Amphibalanus improvisus]|uniref:HAD-IIB family hydrolase n=1 Tax=Spiroplasma endosymbiont of Amphibalanus improvisus TaxID=3066327 RepID=UPI00313B7A20